MTYAAPAASFEDPIMSMPRPKIVHVVYRTRRLAQMLEWYATMFDARIVYRNDAVVFLTFDNEHHRFAFADLQVIAPGVEADDTGKVGVDHVAYEIADLRTLLESYAALKIKGIEPYWCVNHGMSASLYYADPDGNQMEFSIDCFDSKSECLDYFGSGVLNDNPVGVEFDPEAWLAHLRAGVSARDLLVIDAGSEVSPIRGALEHMS